MPPSDARDNEGGEQGTSNAHEAPAVAPQVDRNGSDGREVVEVVTVAGAGPEPSERPAKKMKRGKYISRAWYVKSAAADRNWTAPLISSLAIVPPASSGR